MKKYLMTAMAAVAMGVAFTSCSHNNDFYGGEEGSGKINGRTAQEQIELDKAVYNAAFEKAFGKVAPTVDWGFGSSTRALTRTSDLLKEKFTLPEFRDKDDITEPDTPTFYTTLEQVKAAGIAYVGDIDYNNGWDNVTAAYLDENSNAIRSDRSEGRTYYISGDVKYWNGLSNNGDGVTLVVLENSILHLGCVSHNLKIYLAPGAKLDVTKKYSENWSAGTYPPPITESDWEGQWTFEKSKALLYLSQGSEVIGGDFKFFDGAKIKNNGGTITAANIDVDKNTTLWNNGTVKVSHKLQGVNEKAFIYNAPGKTIEANSLELINNSDLLVNDGTVNVTNEIALQNTGAEIVNNADMECGSFSEAAGAKMYNVGNMTVNGLTHLDNSNSGWQNEGQWTSGSFEIKGTDKGASNNFNNCRLTVHNEFYLNRGAFILDSGAGVECGSFKIDDTSGFYLGNNSVLKIDGTLTTEIINPEYGFFAYGSEYAAIQANSIVTTTNDPESINYYGNLLVAINPHISQYTAESSVKFTKDNQNIATIPETPCNPGYQGNNDAKTTYRVIAEDLSASQGSDFDFNDVVFDVEPNEAGTAAKIILRAAGGKYELKVGDVEVHAAFGEKANDETGLYPLINTNPWNPEKTAILYDAYRGDFSSDAAIRATIQSIPIKVCKPQWEENGELKWVDLEAKTGQAACKILVDQTFKVVTERKGIADENKNFKPYVNGTFQDAFWWKKD